MISLEDCVAMCGLSPEEVAAISAHEHIPEIAAAALGSTLLDRPGGAAEVRRMLVDDIRSAQGRGERKHASELLATLRHFLSEHPDAALSSAAASPP